MRIKQKHRIYYSLLGNDGIWITDKSILVALDVPAEKVGKNADEVWKLGWMRITELHPGRTFSITSTKESK